jgi:drug/metabolite transporter (DMT)-like permease
MLYLFATIIVTSLLFILLKIFSDQGKNTFQIIAVNYLVCTITGILFNHETIIQDIERAPIMSIILGLIIGSCFFPSFNFIGYSINKSGITPTTLANKLSMLMPITYAIILGKSSLNAYAIISLILGVLAIYYITYTPSNDRNNWLFPIIVFLIGGILDIFIYETNESYIAPNFTGTFTTILFFSSCIIGLISLCYARIVYSKKIERNVLFAGILLGLPNYFSIYFLIQTLDIYRGNGGFVYPIVNIGIILITTFFSILYFKNTLSKKQWFGVILSIVSICLVLLDS